MRKFVLTLSALLPVSCLAETPFAGTWVVQPQLTTFNLRPLSFAVGGTYRRTSCLPTPEVPIDGKDHAVVGDPLVQSISVKVLDRNRIEVTEKIADKPVWRAEYTVAKDKQSMTMHFEDMRASKPVSGAIHFTRAGDPLAGSHLLSGTWIPDKLMEISPSGLTMTIQDTDNGFSMRASDGRAFDIKFDRQDYPLTGYLEGATVQVGRRTPTVMQVNRKQKHILVDMATGTLSDDGVTMIWREIDWQCQSQIVWTLHKQPIP